MLNLYLGLGLSEALRLYKGLNVIFALILVELIITSYRFDFRGSLQ
jgi:hypothetical protein